MACWPCTFTVTGIYFGDSSQPFSARDESQQPLAAAVPRIQKQQNSIVQVPTTAKGVRGNEFKQKNKSGEKAMPSPILDVRLLEKTGRKGHSNNAKSRRQLESPVFLSSVSRSSFPHSPSSPGSSRDSTASSGGTSNVQGLVKMKRVKSTNMDHVVRNKSRSPASVRNRKMYKASNIAPGKKVRFATRVQQRIIPSDDLDSSNSYVFEEPYVDPLPRTNAGSPSRRQCYPLIVTKPNHTRASDSIIHRRSQTKSQLNAVQKANRPNCPKVGKRLSVAGKPIFEKPVASEPASGSSIPHNRRARVNQQRQLGKEHLEPIVIYWPNLLSYRQENQNGTAVLRSSRAGKRGLEAKTISKRPSLESSCDAATTKQETPKSKQVRLSKHRPKQDLKHDAGAGAFFRDV